VCRFLRSGGAASGGIVRSRPAGASSSRHLGDQVVVDRFGSERRGSGTCERQWPMEARQDSLARYLFQRKRAVRGGFREIKRSLRWCLPCRLPIKGMSRSEHADLKASHPRKSPRAGLAFAAQNNMTAGLTVVVFRRLDSPLLDLLEQSRAIEPKQSRRAILVPMRVFERLFDQVGFEATDGRVEIDSG